MQIAIAFSGLVVLASAYPAIRDDSSPYGVWQAPGPNDSRSPCPALNTVANHGLLPRNGRNITIDMVTAAINTAYNFHSDFATLVGGLALTVHTPSDGTFDLSDVDRHNYPIEQDNSFSRQDAYFGNQTVFNQTIFDQTLATWAGYDYTSFQLVGNAHYARVLDSKQNNPQWLYGARQYVTSYFRDATGIAAMSDPYSCNASIAWYSYCEHTKVRFEGSPLTDASCLGIENERLPVELGWSRPTQQNTLPTLVTLAAEIAATQPQDVAPVAITVATVNDAFSLTGLLGLDGSGA